MSDSGNKIHAIIRRVFPYLPAHKDDEANIFFEELWVMDTSGKEPILVKDANQKINPNHLCNKCQGDSLFCQELLPKPFYVQDSSSNMQVSKNMHFLFGSDVKLLTGREFEFLEYTPPEDTFDRTDQFNLRFEKNKLKQYVGTLENLRKLIEQPLMQYIFLTYTICAQKDMIGIYKSNELYSLFEELQIKEARRGNKFLGLKKDDDGSAFFELHLFSWKARILAKSKFALLRPNAETEIYALDNLASLNSPSYNFAYSEKNNSIAFELIDYIYFEYYTGVNLAVEIAAMLEKFPSDHDDTYAMIALKALQPYLKKLIDTQYFMSRIFIVRKMLNKASEIFNNSDLKNLESIKNKIDLAYRETLAFNLTYLTSSFNVQADTKNCPSNILDFAEAARNTLTTELSKVIAPINLVKYTKNPRYGTLAFCNDKHLGINHYLDHIDKLISTGTRKNFSRTKYGIRFRTIYSMIYSEIVALEFVPFAR